MKRFYLRFRILLLTLAFGLASVPFAHFLSDRWNEIPINLPQVQSETPIVVYPLNPPFYKKITDEDLIQSRDLSLYDGGQTFSNCFNHGYKDTEFNTCLKQLAESRKFIFKHLKEKKRGYLIYQCSGYDSGSDTYIFIEPDINGQWCVISRGTGDYRYQKLEETKGYSLKYKRATSDDYEFVEGTYFLRVFDENGEEIESF